MYSVLQKEIWKRILYLYFFLYQDQLLFLQSPSLALFHSGCRHPERHYELSFMANYNTAVQRFRVRHGLSCVIGPVWPVGADATTLRQRCPCLSQNRCTSHVHAFLTRMVKPNILVSSHFIHRQTFILGGRAAYGEIFFGENIPGIASFALAIGSSADWLGHEASSK